MTRSRARAGARPRDKGKQVHEALRLRAKAREYWRLAEITTDTVLRHAYILKATQCLERALKAMPCATSAGVVIAFPTAPATPPMRRPA